MRLANVNIISISMYQDQYLVHIDRFSLPSGEKMCFLSLKKNLLIILSTHTDTVL